MLRWVGGLAFEMMGEMLGLDRSKPTRTTRTDLVPW